MRKIPWFFRISGVAALVVVIVVASFAGSAGSNASAATQAAATEKPLAVTDLCKPPPPPTNTPGPSPTKEPPTATATKAPPATKAPATPAPTKAPPTAVPTKAPPTPVPPTATPIPKGQVPAWAGITVNLNKKLLRGGNPCVNVLAVDAKAPAAVAGLKSGDILLGIDTVALKGLPDLYAYISTKVSGDKVKITYQRDGKLATANVTLGLNPNADIVAPATPAATASK